MQQIQKGVSYSVSVAAPKKMQFIPSAADKMTVYMPSGWQQQRDECGDDKSFILFPVFDSCSV